MSYMYEKYLIILRKFAVLSDSRSEPGSMLPQLLQHGHQCQELPGQLDARSAHEPMQAN
jgi:hypothetical protein